MGQENTAPRKINGVEGVLGQVMKSGGPEAVETWGFDDYGLSFEGIVTGVAGAPDFQCASLAGFDDDYFEGYYAYVNWDAGGAGGAPQGQYEVITAYTAGNFTTAAFAPVIAIGDKVLMMHPAIARALDMVTSQGRMLFSLVKWSVGKIQVVIDAAGATTDMSSITIDTLPDGATIESAYLMFKFRMIENTYAGVNKLNGISVALTSQVFQIQDDGGGAWADGIIYVDDFHTLADSAREGGDVIIGTLNVGVANVVDGNDTYNVRLLLGKADHDFINFDDCQVGLDIRYSVV